MKHIFLLIALGLSFHLKAQTSFEISDDQSYPLDLFYTASETALPAGHEAQLYQELEKFKFTPIKDHDLNILFDKLSLDPKARMKIPGGYCATRRAYIQNLLKKEKIITGRLLINCPARNGRLRLQDPVSGRFHTYINFHDANIMLRDASYGLEFMMMDIQFQTGPESLSTYLGRIEAYQKIKPLKNKGSETGFCYWDISTQYYKF